MKFFRQKKPWITVSILFVFGCATTKPIPDRNLIEDPEFTNWFSIRGLGDDADPDATQGVFPSSGENIGKPIWRIAQWGSKYSFNNTAVTEKKEISGHEFLIENPSKRFKVNSEKGFVEMGLFASACYDRPRRQDENWPHLLISCPFTDTEIPSGHCRLLFMKKLSLNLNCKLLNFEDRHPGADPSIHAACFSVNIIVQNLTRGDDGCGDTLRISVPVFDNRHEIIREHFSRDQRRQDTTDRFIFTMDHETLRPVENTFFKNGKIAAGENTDTVATDVNLLPWIHYAFQLARKNGTLQNSSFRDLHVSGITLGWEMTGIYDATMRAGDLALIAEY
ncbi:MAG: hypothetical protein R6V06_00725 [Kiritimatiellia bacterium]